jgi:flagellar motor switch protein FliN
MPDNMLTQEEIDALLKGNYDHVEDSNDLTDSEKDALGEIGNISMGTAATTLFTLLGQKVVITTPKVTITTIKELSDQYPIPFVAVDVKYKLGLEGANLLVLKIDDVKVITDLMMGGDGRNIDRELNEMDLSAISEAMNQMVGSSCTSLSEMFSNMIDIEPPRAFQINLHEGPFNIDSINHDEPIVKISFKMVVGDLIDSQIMQLIPLSFAKNMVNKLLGGDEDANDSIVVDDIQNVKQDHDAAIPQYSYDTIQSKNSLDMGYNIKEEKSKNVNQNQVNVKKLEFQQFETMDNKVYNEGIEIVQEIPIGITVELGRTTRRISEILEYGPGTIIELDKLLGEPLEIYANGKIIAKGEVVVIDDNFGVRITDIINPAKRISKI